ncbi:MAG TPA: HNH endonuclease [Flavipsychrobacter sp.]
MSACYSCHTILNKKNQSAEHILPNSIGGVLKSYRLLCRQCNWAYGMTIDAALAKEFAALAAKLHINRDRPKPNTMRNPDKPIIQLEDEKLHISGSATQVMQIVAGLKRKFPYIDTGSLDASFENDNTPDQHISTKLSIGSDLLLRSVAKIAVNYYLMKTRDSHYLDEIISVIDGMKKNNAHVHPYPLPDGIWKEGEVAHLIIVKGNALLRQLHAHVVLFNTYSYVVLLSGVYDGADVEYYYRYDVVRGKEIKDSISLEYNRNEYLLSI